VRLKPVRIQHLLSTLNSPNSVLRTCDASALHLQPNTHMHLNFAVLHACIRGVQRLLCSTVGCMWLYCLAEPSAAKHDPNTALT
jgi:hypothetical protein